MIKPKIFLLLVLPLTISSCNEKTEIISKWENGKVKKERIHAGKNLFTENEYYENGQLETSTSYRNGKRNGEGLAFYQNGQKMGEVTYIEDKVNGKCVEYFSNGVLRFEGQQEMGKLVGLAKYYHANGKIKMQVLTTDSVTLVHKWDSLGNQIQ